MINRVVQILLGLAILSLQLIETNGQIAFDSVLVTIPTSGKVLAVSQHNIILNFQTSPAGTIALGSTLFIRISLLKYFSFIDTPPNLSSLKYQIGSQVQIAATGVTGTLTATYYEISVPNINYSFGSLDKVMQISFIMQNARCLCRGYFETFIIQTGSVRLYTGIGNYLYAAENSTSCNISEDSNITGKKNLISTLSFQPKFDLQPLSNVRIQFTKWFADMNEGVFDNLDETQSCDYSAQPGQSTLFNTAYTCSLSSSPTDNFIRFNSINAVLFPNSQTYFLKLKLFRNPFSTMPESITIRLEENVQGNYELKEQCSYLINANVPNQFTYIVTPLTPSTNLLVQQTINFQGTSQTPFSATYTFLRIIYDAPMIVTHLRTLIGSRMQIDVFNFLGSNQSTGTNYNFNLKIQSPPFARTNSIKFQIMYQKDASNIYTQEEIATEYQFQTLAGVLITTISSILDPTVGVITQYVFKITVSSTYTPGQKLNFNFPVTSFTLSSATCSYVSGPINNSLSCTQISSQEIESSNFVSTTLNPGDIFEVKVTGIRNPLTTVLSDIIKIQTRTAASQVIEDNAGIQVKAEPQLLNIVLNMNANDKTVYSVSSIAFEITPAVTIPTGGFIEITFPSDLTYNTQPTLSNPVNLGATLITGTYPIYSIQTQTALPATTKFSFTLVGIRNPTSLKATSSFIVRTLDTVGNALEQKKTGLTVQMIQRATTSAVVITASTQFTGEQNVTYNFKITLKVPQTGTNTFTIVFPNEIQLNSTIICNALIGLASIVCIKSTNSIQATVTFATFPADSIVNFEVKTANNFIVSGVYNFSFVSDTSAGYGIEQNLAVNFTLKPSQFTAVTGNNIQTKMTNTDNIYQIIINPKTQLPLTGFPITNSSVEISLPDQVNILSNTSCQIVSPISLNCSIDNILKKFSCKPATAFDQPITIRMTNIGFNYISTGISDSLIVSTAYNGNPIDQATTGLQLIHNCNTNCFGCTTPNSAQCTSCFSNALTNFSLLQGNTCKTACDSGYVAVVGSSVCQSCQNNCLTCSITTTNCNSCSGLFFLEGTNCVSICQPGFYGDKVTNKCLKCSFPCSTCDSSSSFCLTCINDVTNSINIYAYKGACVASCPVDVSVQQGNQCIPCTTNCIKCQNDPNNCLLCKDPYNLSGTICVSTCPNTTYPNGGKCQKCFDPCVTCSGSPSYCTSCATPYYVYNGSCVNPPCPNATFQVDANRSCNSCSIGCSACKSLTECTLCDSTGSFPVLYNQQCLTECPQDKPFKSSGGCEECDQNCLMCKGSKEFCTACKSQQYLYSGKCLSECPSGYVKNSITNACDNPVTRETRIYFPYLIGAIIFLAITSASKAMAKSSQFFTNATAFTSVFEFLSWLTTGILMFNYNNAYEERNIKVIIGVYWFGFIIYLITNILAFIYIKKKFLTDIKFQTWKQQSTGHKHSTNFIQIFTLIFSFKFFRFIYGRFLNRSYLSARFIDNEIIFKPTNFLSIFSFLFSSTFIIAGSALSCYETQLIQDNLYYFSIEAIILTLMMLFFVIGDIFKESDYFAHDIPMNLKSRVYIDDGSTKKDPLMSVDVRNELEKNVLQKSLAYDRLNNSNLNNTNTLLKQRSVKNGQSSLQEIEAENMNDISLYNSMLNSQHKITSKKVNNDMIKEEDNEVDRKKNGKLLNGAASPNKKNGISPSNRVFSPSNGVYGVNGDQNKRACSIENISISKVLAAAATQTQPADIRDNTLKDKKKSQQSLKNLNKTVSKSPDKNDKNSTSNGIIQPSSRSPTNINKNGSKMLDSNKKIMNDENNDQVLNGKDCHHLIRVYDKNGNNSGSKPNLNQTSNIQASPRGQNGSKTKKSPKLAGKKNGSTAKNGKSKQNSQGLIGLDEDQVDNAYNPKDGSKQFNGLKNLKTYDSKVLRNGNSADTNGKSDQSKKGRNIMEDASGVQDDGDDDDEKSIIQDTPSNYNYLNMRYESKDLINMQLGKPYQNNLLASTGMKTLPKNMSPLNYGSPNPLDAAYASTSSSQIQNSQVKNPIQNAFFTPRDSPSKQQLASRIPANGSTAVTNRNQTKKQLSITPSNQSYSRNNSPIKGGLNGHTYSVTPTSNTFAHNGQNVIKTHSDYEEGIKISKILEQQSQKKMSGQPFFMTQNMSQSSSKKQQQDYLDNYDYSIPQTTMHINNNSQNNNFLTEHSKVRSGSNPKLKVKSSSRVTKTLEADPKIKQLEDIYNQKLVPSSNPRISSNQGSQNSRLKSNKKSVNGLMINDPANFSDYEGDINPGYF